MAGNIVGIEGVGNDYGGKYLSHGDYPGLASGGKFAYQADPAHESFQGGDVLLNILPAILEQVRAVCQEIPRQFEMPFPELGQKFLDPVLVLGLGFFGHGAKQPGHPCKSGNHHEGFLLQFAFDNRNRSSDRSFVLDGCTAEFDDDHVSRFY